MKWILFFFGLVLSQPDTYRGRLHSELSADIWDAEINSFLDTATRMALGSTSKPFKLMTHRLNRLSEAALIPKRQSCDFAMRVQLSGSGYGMFKNADDYDHTNSTELLIDQTTCLGGYVPKINQFDHVFDDLLIRLPIHDTTDNIKSLEDIYLTWLERLFEQKKHFKSVTVEIIANRRHEDYRFDSLTEERLFRMMRGTTIDNLKLKFDIYNLEHFSSFAMNSNVLKLLMFMQKDSRVYNIIRQFRGLKSLFVNTDMISTQLHMILESLPSLESLSLNSKLLPRVKMFSNIKHLSIRKCMQEFRNQSFSGLQSLSIGLHCIEESQELRNILETNRATLTKFSFTISSSDIMNVISHCNY